LPERQFRALLIAVRADLNVVLSIVTHPMLHQQTGNDLGVCAAERAPRATGVPEGSPTRAGGRAGLGQPLSVTYPDCTAPTSCGGSDNSYLRTVSSTHTNGFLTAVGGYASSISYHPNGMVNQVLHANNVRSTQAIAGNQMARPLSITVQDASTSATLWATGNYVYDGAGNITRAGGNYYLYDPFGRVTEGTAEYVSGSNHKLQRHTYDAFGNMTSMNTVVNGTTTVARTIAVPTSTNRLTTSPFSATYDSAGNLKQYGNQQMSFDSQSMMRTTSGLPVTAGSPQIDYYYTAGDERIWQHNRSANTSRWTVRDLDHKVLREYTTSGSATAQSWTFAKDYVYRGSAAVASVTPLGGTSHFHLDHLGSTRAVTNGSKVVTARTDHYPFGEEATTLTPETKQYTGHERDYLGGTGTQNADYLDYMHARYYTPIVGRFLSVDPVLDMDKTLRQPQKWNRYTYVLNNPMKYSDPDGREEQLNGGGTVVNNSSQTVYIAFDGQMGMRSTDYVIPLKPGESSQQFSFDADAVIVAPGPKHQQREKWIVQSVGRLS
jgi:RHS repeat-associated protein